MTLRLSDEERGIVLRTLKARLDALHAEMTQTDSPEFNIQLKRDEKIVQALIERLDSGWLGRSRESRRPRSGAHEALHERG